MRQGVKVDLQLWTLKSEGMTMRASWHNKTDGPGNHRNAVHSVLFAFDSYNRESMDLSIRILRILHVYYERKKKRKKFRNIAKLYWSQFILLVNVYNARECNAVIERFQSKNHLGMQGLSSEKFFHCVDLLLLLKFLQLLRSTMDEGFL